jgi:hypothetical protein
MFRTLAAANRWPVGVFFDRSKAQQAKRSEP